MATLPVESGQACRNWDDVFRPSFVMKYLEWAEPRNNYCRNIFTSGLEPSCYNEDAIPEPCGVKPCDENSCSLSTVSVRSGRLSPSRNFYRVGEKVFISCDAGYFMDQEEDMWITCTENGRWSKSGLECSVDYELKLSNTLLDSERYSPQLAPSREHVEVIFEAAVVEIIDADEKNENMFASIAFRLQWKDGRLSWNPTDYGDRGKEIVVSSKKVWTPDIYLRRNGDAKFSDFPDARVTINSDGFVKWDIIDLLTTTCDLEPALFPFDSMECPVCLGANTRVERFSCAESQDNTSVHEQKSPVENFMVCGEEDKDVVDQWNARWTAKELLLGESMRRADTARGTSGNSIPGVWISRHPLRDPVFPVILYANLRPSFGTGLELAGSPTFGFDFRCLLQRPGTRHRRGTRWSASGFGTYGAFGKGCIDIQFDRLPTFHFCTTLSPPIILSLLMCITFLLPTEKKKRLSAVVGSWPARFATAVLIIVYMCLMGVFLIATVINIRVSSMKVFLVYVARLVLLGDLTQTEEGPTPRKVEEDHSETVTGITENDSKPAEVEPSQLRTKQVLMSLKESVNDLNHRTYLRHMSYTTRRRVGKPDCQKLARVFDRICFILYVSGLIIAIPIVRYAASEN
ncbi:Carboxylesterase 5A [Branchiostoma belcheri]|nr:Carboxylesterase 5A [Branchiostoma belcheri]